MIIDRNTGKMVIVVILILDNFLKMYFFMLLLLLFSSAKVNLTNLHVCYVNVAKENE